MESLGAGDILIVSAFAGFEALFTPSAMLPSIMTIGTFVDSPEKVGMIRQGEVIASLFNLAFGVALAWLSHSIMPLVFTVGATLAVMGVYEFALRQAPAFQMEG